MLCSHLPEEYGMAADLKYSESGNWRGRSSWLEWDRLFTTFGYVAPYILHYGSETLKQKYSKLVSGEMVTE